MLGLGPWSITLEITFLYLLVLSQKPPGKKINLLVKKHKGSSHLQYPLAVRAVCCYEGSFSHP